MPNLPLKGKSISEQLTFSYLMGQFRPISRLFLVSFKQTVQS